MFSCVFLFGEAAHGSQKLAGNHMLLTLGLIRRGEDKKQKQKWWEAGRGGGFSEPFRKVDYPTNCWQSIGLSLQAGECGKKEKKKKAAAESLDETSGASTKNRGTKDPQAENVQRRRHGPIWNFVSRRTPRCKKKSGTVTPHYMPVD